MNKLIIALILALYTFLTPVSSKAGAIDVPQISYGNIAGGASMQKLSDNIYIMAKSINKASSELMKFGDMLFCSSLHGKAADWEIFDHNIRVVSFELFFSACILIMLGFMVSVIASFYMFDVAFNLSISIVLLPLGIALWPFGWTKNKLKILVENIAYYVGVFIFLPLGILLANTIVQQILSGIFGSSSDLIAAFQNDQADLIEDKLALFSLSFLSVLLSYIIAIRIIPLFANEFCGHFFSGPVADSPISQRLSQLLSGLKRRTIGRFATYGKNVAAHQFKKLIK